MPSHLFKFNQRVKRLRRLASTLANVDDVAELLQRHVLLVHCSSMRDARGLSTFSRTAPLTDKQALEVIHRGQTGCTYEGEAPPGEWASTTRETSGTSSTESTELLWKHPELLPGTIVLPDLKSRLPGEDRSGKEDRFIDDHVINTQLGKTLADIKVNNHTAWLELQHFNQQTEVETLLIHPHSKADKNNTHNSPGGDLTTANNERLQSTQKTKIPQESGEPSQNATQLHALEVNRDKIVTFNLKDSSVLTEVPDSKQCNSTGKKLTKVKSFSDKNHNQRDKDMSHWFASASQIRFKPLPQTQNRPIQPLADDYKLVMRLLEKGKQNDADLLKSIGIAEGRNQMRPRRWTSRPLQPSLTVLPPPRKPVLATSATRAQKPSEGVRRRQRSSSTQRRQKSRTPQNSTNRKKATADVARGTAQSANKHSANKQASTSRNTSNAKKRQKQRPQPKSSTVIVHQRAAPEAKHLAQTAASKQKKLLVAKAGARSASQASVPTKETSKPTLTSDLRRVVEASAAKTQHALKRAASDCQRLARTSTPSTNNLLKRVASDLKKISRESMISFHNLQQEEGSSFVPKALPTRTGTHVHPNSSKVQKCGAECFSTSSSIEIKCHLPIFADSMDRHRVTQQSSAKPSPRNLPFKCDSVEAGKFIAGNPDFTIAFLEANTKPQHNIIINHWDGLQRPESCKNTQFMREIIPENPVPTIAIPEANQKPELKNINTDSCVGLQLPKCSNDTQFGGKCNLEYPCTMKPLTENIFQRKEDVYKNNPWRGLRPPMCSTGVAQHTLTSIPACGMQLHPDQTIEVQNSAIHNMCDELRPLSTKDTRMSMPPLFSSLATINKECVPQPSIPKKIDFSQPSMSEGLLPVSDIVNNDKIGAESLEDKTTLQVWPIPNSAHDAMKSFIFDSQTSQESFVSAKNLPSRKHSFSSLSSADSILSSGSFSRSEVSDVTEKKRDDFSHNESQEIPEKSVSSSKRIPFFRKVRKIFRIKFSCCRPKLPCMRSCARGVSSSSIKSLKSKKHPS